jgi:hypothetical protein
MTGDWELANRGRAKILAYFQELMTLHAQTHGSEPRMHKETEPACVQGVLFRALASENSGGAFVGELTSSLVWKQCLGNLNHRTTELFVTGFLIDSGVPVVRDAEIIREITETWHAESKRIMRSQESAFDVFGASDRQRKQHAEAAAQWVVAMAPDQSDRLAKIGPNSLRSFLSSSVSTDVS